MISAGTLQIALNTYYTAPFVKLSTVANLVSTASEQFIQPSLTVTVEGPVIKKCVADVLLNHGVLRLRHQRQGNNWQRAERKHFGSGTLGKDSEWGKRHAPNRRTRRRRLVMTKYH